jgi:hypothetical protein
MNSPREPDHELEDRVARRLLDVFIRVGLVLCPGAGCASTSSRRS